MSQLVRLEGKDTTQSAHCALGRKWGAQLPNANWSQGLGSNDIGKIFTGLNIFMFMCLV